MNRTRPSVVALVFIITSALASAALPCVEMPEGPEGSSPAANAQDVPTNAQLFVGADEWYDGEALVLREITSGAEQSVETEGWWPLTQGLLPELAPHTAYAVSGLYGPDGEPREITFTTGAGPDLKEPSVNAVSHDVSAPRKAEHAGCGSMDVPFWNPEVMRELTVDVETDDAVAVELLRIYDGEAQVSEAAFVSDGRATIKHEIDEEAGTFQLRAIDAAGNEAFGDEFIVAADAGGCAQARGASATVALLAGLAVRRRRQAR